jgi:hypothetical protein
MQSIYYHESFYVKKCDKRVSSKLTILCCVRKRMVSLKPEDTKFEVYPKKILHFVCALVSGSKNSFDSSGEMGSSDSLQEIYKKTI